MKRMFRNVNPSIIIILLVMGGSRFMSGGSISDWIYDTLVSLPGIIIALTSVS